MMTFQLITSDMGRPNQGGHVRRLKGFVKYRAIRVMVDGKSKQVLEHRYVMEQHLGRKLDRSEHVHHKDGDGLNNAIENLQVMSARDHQHHHLMGTRKWPVEEGIKLRQEGRSLLWIADHFGVSEQTVLKAFRVRGISTKQIASSQRPQWDPEQSKKMKDEGMTFAQIGERFGVSGTAVRTGFKRRGWI